ncbi:Anaphase-promoting complex subunit 4 WD40 domain [Phytophthora infestans]|uniref:Anaphase-promoting complex subunit 4 WD40 domain n=1 Tax=Phytophthora infestans TaxID=4787 RepID=A0A833T3V8_PHYIN|nr:Anaphase-promoting complex subunit 4 WD40 domain [Phytophthora infestans]KAF4131439.1 Anaphase-promoting complex subunit 4 WD40 domain [Phytophthora infestans]
MSWVLPNEDAVTLGELNGELYSVSKRDAAHVGDEFVRRGGCVFPPARVASSKPRPFGQGESLTDEQDEELDSGALRLVKRALKSAKSFLVDDELDVLNRALNAVGSTAQRLLKIATDDEELEQETLDTTTNGESIVDMSWHPTRNVLAVAQLDGVVALYSVESASWDARVLEHPKQVDIGSIEWGKFTGDTLAVACRTGLFLWKLPRESKEPVLQEILKYPSHDRFSQVCWNADGSLLAAFTKGSKSVIVFDTIFSRHTELQSPYKLSSLYWSPTGEYLFVITESGVSLMWETLTWKRETWEVAAGGCGWSSDGRCLLVGLRNSALLYPYIFQGCPPSIDAQISSPALDFAEKELFSLDRSTSAIVGGKIQDVAWDPSGSRVAVTYQTSAIGSHEAGTAKLVAIFSVAWQPFLIFTRSGLLRGPPNAGVPRRLAFASNFKHGALLSVAWSSGLISFHPFYLKDPKAP